MNEDLSDKVGRVTREPGVYLMRDAGGKVLYVGKAGNLRRRLAAYFKPSSSRAAPADGKTAVLIRQVADFDTVITASEQEALILESNLIKRYRPRYNVVLKDDKRYLSLRFDLREAYPRLAWVRKPADDGALVFGPFASAAAVRQTLKFINKTFKLRKCSRRVFGQRTRPCLFHQMDQCLAPCCREVDPARYERIVKEVVLLLKGRAPELVRRLRREMHAAAERQEYERAARLRDRIFALEKTLERQVAVTTDFKDRDVLAAATGEGRSLVTLMSVRGGMMLGTRHFEFEDPLSAPNEILTVFLRQYYERRPQIPKEILVSHRLAAARHLSTWLNQSSGHRVRLLHPRRGEKAALMRRAMANAESRLKELAVESATGRRQLERLQRKLQTERLPQRIECFDNSTLAGSEPVAGMVVYSEGLPFKSAYRCYRLDTVRQPDDYAAMREVLTRRFTGRNASQPLPDLVLIDGGRGQLGIAGAVMHELDLDGRFDLAGIAKSDPARGLMHDRIYRPGRVNPLPLSGKDPTLLFLQQIRDAAHRFAVGFHRRRRRAVFKDSALDAVPGVGKKRKALLLQNFGSVERLRRATLEDLCRLPGISRRLAEAIVQGLASGG